MSSSPTGSSLSYADRLSVLADVALPIWVFDIDKGIIDWANEPALLLWEADDLNELRSRNFFSDQSSRVAIKLEQLRDDFLNGRTSTEQYTIFPKGIPKSLTCRFSGIVLPDGRMAMLNQACGDTGSTQEKPENLRSLNALLHTSVQVSLYDLDGVPLHNNPAAYDAWPEHTKNLADHFVAKQDYVSALSQLAISRETQTVVEVHTSAGERWHEIDLRYTFDAVTGHPAILMSATDVTDRKIAQDKAAFLAFHDTLTGLPNRAQLLQKAPTLFAQIMARRQSATLIFVDLDRFKSINDTLGHMVGDELLIAFAERLRQATDTKDLLARLSGDEFIILTEEPQTAEQLESWINRLEGALNQPYDLSHHTVRCSVSMGLCRMPDNGTDINQLLQNADIAMYEAKRNRRGSFRVFSREMSSRFSRKFQLEKQLQTVLERDELELHYQPRLSLETGEIVGAEALLRWRHPEEGLISPADFIPLMEETGLILDVGEWVLKQACKSLASWQALDPNLTVSVNISGQQCLRPGAAERLLAIVDHANCHTDGLEFEITESVLLGDNPVVRGSFQAFHKAGIGLAVDDFGTGYSNLAYIQNYPISCIKIDRSFVGDQSKAAITELIISMSRILDVKIIAEGVETVDQHDWLKQRGCHEYQGFLFSPAVSGPEFEALIRTAYTPAQKIRIR
ncbi:putative bifunctional diguanylate cyclase/phosphodiesterase [Coralliovum pocilloporae]|uniref:putative bifunctional diguanylate cyclase/phosphodiesterase n=1 Tax=Coralliovum pocilloporae TaxID=3066369 RepID=UPI003306E3F6